MIYFKTLEEFVQYTRHNMALALNYKITLEQLGWRIAECDIDRWRAAYPELDRMDIHSHDLLSPDLVRANAKYNLAQLLRSLDSLELALRRKQKTNSSARQLTSPQQVVSFLHGILSEEPEKLDLPQQKKVAARIVGLIANEQFDHWQEKYPVLTDIVEFALDMEWGNVDSMELSWAILKRDTRQLEHQVYTK